MPRPVPIERIEQTMIGRDTGPWISAREVAERLDVSIHAARTGLNKLVKAGQATSHRTLNPIPTIQTLRPDITGYTGKLVLFRLDTQTSSAVVVHHPSADTPPGEPPPPPPPDPATVEMMRFSVMGDGTVRIPGDQAAKLIESMTRREDRR